MNSHEDRSRHIGTPVDMCVARELVNAFGIKGKKNMAHSPNSVNFGVGGLAFIAGVLATLVTAYAVVSRKSSPTQKLQYHYDGWDDSLGL
jgi:hypothetical protein